MLPTLLLSLSLGTAQASDPDAEGDVIALIEISAPQDVVHRYLMNLSNHADLSPEDCTRRWEMGARHEGVGASATLVYVAPPIWRRSLTVVLLEETDTRILLDHPGNHGFVTTFDFASTGRASTTHLTMHTWISAPPKPFQGVYFRWVRPHWRECQERFLTNLAAAVGQ
jgi:hypothetical protein